MKMYPLFYFFAVALNHAILCPMKKQRLLAIFSIVFLSLSIVIVPGNAQGPTDLSALTIKLWPEYDDPRLLVIIDGKLVTPGSEIRLPLPAEAQLNAVATDDGSGRLLKNEWREEKADDGSRLLVMVPQNPLFRVEYYTPFSVDGDKRNITFELPAGYFNAEQAAIEVLLPPGSEDVKLVPTADESGPAQDQAHIFQRTLGAVKDQAITQQVTYANPGGELTVSAESSSSVGAPQGTEASSQEPTGAETVAKSATNPWIIALGAAAVLLILGGAVGLWLTRDREEEAPAAPAPSRTKGKKKKKTGAISMQPSPKDLDRFCRQCGKEFGPDDRFCRYCGAQRRSL